MKRNEIMAATLKKFDGKIQDNYDKYLNTPIRIGFTKEFPVKEVLKETTYQSVCRRFNVEFKVMLCKVTFGNENQWTATAIVTDRVDVGSKLGAYAFNSHCHVDEARTMELGVIQFAKENNLMICNKINSWPFAKAIVQENFYKE